MYYLVLLLNLQGKSLLSLLLMTVMEMRIVSLYLTQSLVVDQVEEDTVT